MTPTRNRTPRRFASQRSPISTSCGADLKVMDLTAITLCQENKLPILVFNMNRPGNFRHLVLGEPVGTKVHDAVSS